MRSLIQPILHRKPLLTLSTAGVGTLLLATTLISSSSSSSSNNKPHSSSSRMSSNQPSSPQDSWPIKPYTPRHATWPYKPSDFTRADSTPDTQFYRAPRFVTHIDDAAIGSLREYYDTVLPRRGRILDFCSSWVSHYPAAVEEAAAEENGELRVTGMGMNKAELDANDVLESGGRVVVDLNVRPDVAGILREEGFVATDTTTTTTAKEGTATETDTGSTKKGSNSSWKSDLFDASTNVVSTDYLTQPVEVLTSLRSITNVGGTVHLAISNRCFPTKAISRWLRVDEEERLQMVGDFLHFAGWKKIEIVQLSDGTAADAAGRGGGFQSIMQFVGMPSRDPLWVVRAVKE